VFCGTRGIDRGAAAVVLCACIASCREAPPRVHVALTEQLFTLTPQPTTFTPRRELRADNDVVGVCVELAPGFGPGWLNVGISTPHGRAHLAGSIKLASGVVLALRQPSQMGEQVCIHPDMPGPLPARVTEVSIWTSRPVAAVGATWISTAP
jgi:hypothetical protein